MEGEVQLKRKRVGYQDIPNAPVANPIPTDLTIPESLAISTQQWRKLRLLEARLVGRVLAFENETPSVLSETSETVPIVVTETMNTQASFDFPITDSIIPESPRVGSKFVGLLKNMETQDALEHSSSSCMNDDMNDKENLGFSGVFDGHDSQAKLKETWEAKMQGVSISKSENPKSVKKDGNKKKSETPFISQSNTPSKEQSAGVDLNQKESPSTPSGMRMKRIDEYFQPKSGTSKSNKKKEMLKIETQSESLKEQSALMKEFKQQLNVKDAHIKELESQIQAQASQLNHLKAVRREFEFERTGFEKRYECLRREAQEMNKETAEYGKRARDIIAQLKIQIAVQNARESRLTLNKDSQRLASVFYERRGVDFHECWKEGFLFQDKQDQLLKISREKDALEKHKKNLSKRLKQSKLNFDDHLSSQLNESNHPTDSDPITTMEYNELEEIARLRIAALKKEESDILLELDKLAIERDLHIRQVRRIREEDQSRFNNHPIFKERYLLLELIGKGGFSEVYKAYDLQELRQVACKIHSLSEQWSDERKKSYTKHSIREYHIHKSLDHPRIVQLYDVFELDHYSFCTILEYVPGRDLETYLSMVKTIPEKEAHSIIVQLTSALRYMNELKDPIIHYDLKPANILYHNGLIKITDFGLSKIVNTETTDNDARGFASNKRLFECKEMALTSQGAGTYWYLPPEVFIKSSSDAPVTISSKVDVWSLGCIFYEILYGSKPFGNNQSQQTILKELTIMNESHCLSFPAKPLVSQEAKEFIKRCLEYQKERRPDVLTLAKDSYLGFFQTRKTKSLLE